jgi:hypothetical protein
MPPPRREGEEKGGTMSRKNIKKLSWRFSLPGHLAIVLIVCSSILFSLPVAIDSDSVQEKIQQPTLQYEVSVSLKLIQVFVMDKQGRPVTDLNKSDFEIYDNGILKTITEFEKHLLVRPAIKPEPQKIAVPAAAPQPKLNRKFFFVFDLQHSDVPGFARSKKAAYHFLDTQVQATDEIGVLSQIGRASCRERV